MPLRRMSWISCGLVPVLLVTCATGVVHCPCQVVTRIKTEDPVGAWKLSCVSPDGKQRECVVNVYREGSALKGDYAADGVTRAAKNVVFSDGVLTVDVDGKFAGQSYGLTYKGTPQGDVLQGSVRWSFGWASGSFAFEGERIKEQIASNR